MESIYIPFQFVFTSLVVSKNTITETADYSLQRGFNAHDIINIH